MSARASLLSDVHCNGAVSWLLEDVHATWKSVEPWQAGADCSDNSRHALIGRFGELIALTVVLGSGNCSLYWSTESSGALAKVPEWPEPVGIQAPL